MTTSGHGGVAGRLYCGTSGFGYASWAPRFYRPDEVRSGLLAAYAARLPAVELHTTFYRRPPAAVVEAWVAATLHDFRFCPKAQRGAAWRAWSGPDARGPVAWLTEALAGFGERLGCVLLSAPTTLPRDDGALERLLGAWPSALPLALELPHPTWARDEVHDRLASSGVALVATDVDGSDEPDLRRIGPFLYLRLRRASYSDADLLRWGRRLQPFLADGMDAFVFFRHDADGTSARRAESLLRLVPPSGVDAEDDGRWEVPDLVRPTTQKDDHDHSRALDERRRR